MPRKTKVYFIRTTTPTGIHLRQADHIVQCTAAVTATSQAHAAERFGVSLHALRTWGGDYGTDQPGLVPDAARARPGTVVYFPLDPRPGDTPVYGPTQLGYEAPDTQPMVQRARAARVAAGLDPDALPGGERLAKASLADNQLADTSTDEELSAMLSALSPIRGSEEDPRPVPTKDQSYCQVGDCQGCSGLTEDEADPETCMCSCHSPEHVLGDTAPAREGTAVSWPPAILEALDATRTRPRHRPYTVVLAWVPDYTMWDVAAVLEGHHRPVEGLDLRGKCVEFLAPEGADLNDAAWEIAQAQD